MFGYKWAPQIRTTPQNGAGETFNLATALSDARGPVAVDLQYDDLGKLAVGINREQIRSPFGFRPVVGLRCQIHDVRDQETIAKIVDRLERPEEWSVYLSLDGGVVERRVVLAAVPSPKPLGGKTHGGIEITLRLACVDPITTLPAMAVSPTADVRRPLLDEGFEEWDDATTPTFYARETNGGTVNREATEIRSGTYSARLTRTTTGNLTIRQEHEQYLAGKTYEFSVWAKGASAIAGGLNFRVRDLPAAVYWTGSVWSATITNSPSHDVTTSWARYAWLFRCADDHVAADKIRTTIRHGNEAANVSLYLDDAAVVGPVRPEGVAAW